MGANEKIAVTFQPSGRKVYVLPGTRLIEAAARAGLLLRNPCGGRGTCGKCRIQLTRGECFPGDGCRNVFTAEEIEAGWRLACQTRVIGDCVFHVPPASLFESESKILINDAGEHVTGSPALGKRYIELDEPSLEDPEADFERVVRRIGDVQADLAQLARLSRRLRENGWKGTVVTCDGHFIDFEPGNDESAGYAVAFDLGTTTLVGTLVNTVTGAEEAVSAEMNPQISVGDDVISRITLAREDPEQVSYMQRQVVAAFNDLITGLCADAGIKREMIHEASVAGNTTMQHLFCGISPAALGEIPFVPSYRGSRAVPARDVGLAIHPAARLYVFPHIGGFVGGDTVSGILANSLQRCTETTLFIDIGTNGEIVLAHEGVLRATSCAAGPAFEGARIEAGMRAADGAIEKILFDGEDLVCDVIGSGKAKGICGTALIDIVAELLELGVIDETGRILSAAEVPDSVPEAIRARLHEIDGETHVLLVSGADASSGHPLYLIPRDIRELQLASGAIRAGVMIMLRQAGIGVEDVRHVLLAGGFGNYIRRENACRIGLLPAMPVSSIRFVGNAASMGAKTVLFSREHRAEAERIAMSTEHIDLSLDPEFQMEFGMAMMFPSGAA